MTIQENSVSFNFIFKQFNNDVGINQEKEGVYTKNTGYYQPFNRDNNLYYVQRLSQYFVDNNYTVHTSDYYVNRDISPEIVIFFDLSKYHRSNDNRIWDSSIKILIINECEAICPSNWDYTIHTYFDLIFTWNKDIVDGVKYIYMPTFFGFTYDKVSDFNLGFENRTVFVNIICSK